jgi:hypothetical protein
MKARYVVGPVVAVGLLATVCFLLVRNSEPRYAGRSLSYWLNEANVYRSEGATNAIRAIGTNAWPFLVKRAGARNSKIERLLITELGFELIKYSGRSNMEGAIGLEIGPQLKPFLPDIILGLTNSRGVFSIVLGEIGEPALPTAIACLTNADSRVRIGAANSFYFFKCDTSSAKGALMNAVRDPERTVALRAASLVAKMKPNGDTLEFFVNNLSSTNRLLVLASMNGLRFIGPSASNALPALLKVAESADTEVSRRATSVIKLIEGQR